MRPLSTWAIGAVASATTVCSTAGYGFFTSEIEPFDLAACSGRYSLIMPVAGNSLRMITGGPSDTRPLAKRFPQISLPEYSLLEFDRQVHRGAELRSYDHPIGNSDLGFAAIQSEHRPCTLKTCAARVPKDFAGGQLLPRFALLEWKARLAVPLYESAPLEATTTSFERLMAQASDFHKPRVDPSGIG